jgi:hypothetical protein
MDTNRTNEFKSGIRHIDMVVLVFIGVIVGIILLVFCSFFLCQLYMQFRHGDIDDDTIHFVEIFVDRKRPLWLESHPENVDDSSGENTSNAAFVPRAVFTANDTEQNDEMLSVINEGECEQTNELDVETGYKVELTDLKESCTFRRT